MEINPPLVILALIILLFVIILSNSIDTYDLDDICNNVNATLKRTASGWDCNILHFAEGYTNTNYTSPLEVNITAVNNFVNITDWLPMNYNGFVFESNGVTVQKTAIYHLAGTISFSGGNGGEYGFGVLVDGIPKKHCSMGLTASSTDVRNLKINCLLNLEAGNHLNVAVQDRNTPVQDIEVFKTNFNIIEVV